MVISAIEAAIAESNVLTQDWLSKAGATVTTSDAVIFTGPAGCHAVVLTNVDKTEIVYLAVGEAAVVEQGLGVDTNVPRPFPLQAGEELHAIVGTGTNKVAIQAFGEAP